MSTETKRTRRIAKSIKQKVGETLLHHIRDPRIQDCGLVTVTDVEVTKDLRYAKVFVSLSTQDEQEKKNALAGFAAATAFIRGEIGRSLSLRRVPQLSFFIDETLSHAMKIENLLDEISKENDVRDAHPEQKTSSTEKPPTETSGDNT